MIPCCMRAGLGAHRVGGPMGGLLLPYASAGRRGTKHAMKRRVVGASGRVGGGRMRGCARHRTCNRWQRIGLCCCSRSSPADGLSACVLLWPHRGSALDAPLSRCSRVRLVYRIAASSRTAPAPVASRAGSTTSADHHQLPRVASTTADLTMLVTTAAVNVSIVMTTRSKTAMMMSHATATMR